jgi:hypothetical protein
MKKFIIKSNENLDNIKEPWRTILIFSVCIILDFMVSMTHNAPIEIIAIFISCIFVLWRILYEIIKIYE